MNPNIAFDRAKLEQAAKELDLRLIVLFGSHAKGTPPPGPDSDVDVAVLGCPTADLGACYGTLSRLFGSVNLDLVRLEDADPLFRQEIMEQGVLLAGDADCFCEYRAFAYRDFVDSHDLRALEHTLFRRKMSRMRHALG